MSRSVVNNRIAMYIAKLHIIIYLSFLAVYYYYIGWTVFIHYCSFSASHNDYGS